MIIDTLDLPIMRFFEPTDKFVAWMKNYSRGSVVVDAGAGAGHVSNILNLAGVSVIAIDFIKRENTDFTVILADATTFSYPAGCTVLIARPCHSSWVKLALDKALETAKSVLYVGFEKNLENDLGNDIKPTLVLEGAGTSGENVYEITSQKEKSKVPSMKTWTLVSVNGMPPSWYEDSGDCWTNTNGGFSPKGDKDEVLDAREVEDILDLDWTKTFLLVQDSDIGWLDREGRFYGCSYAGHDDIAYYILKKEVGDLEREGWVRVDGAQVNPDTTSFRFAAIDNTIGIRYISPAQHKWLNDHGHNVPDYFVRD